jgi:hypothetical protein
MVKKKSQLFLVSQLFLGVNEYFRFIKLLEWINYYIHTIDFVFFFFVCDSESYEGFEAAKDDVRGMT